MHAIGGFSVHVTSRVIRYGYCCRYMAPRESNTIGRFGFYSARHDFWQTRGQRAGIMCDYAAIDGEAQMDASVACMQPQLAGRDAATSPYILK